MEYKMGPLEKRFAEMIWDREPVASSELMKLAAEELNWKKSTMFTVLRRLCDKGIFQNVGGKVTSLLSREQYAAAQSTQFVEETFGGSLPTFLAAFSSGRKLSESEITELQMMIDRQKNG